MPNDDSLPFYWTSSEQAARGTSKSISFFDFSRRDPAALATTNPITWDAELYAVNYDGNTTVTIHDGVSWGWTLKPAIIGGASGTFLNPSPTCPPATCNGIGTSTVSWGTGESGSLSFVGDSYAPEVDDKFKIGTLTYHNGSTDVGSSVDAIDLDISMEFDNVPEENLMHHTTLRIINTLNNSDPVASADFVEFTTGGFGQSFHVFEGRSASVDLMGKLSATLQLQPNSNANSDKDPIDLSDPDVWRFSMQLVGFENPTSGGFVTDVPEPSTILLMLSAAFLLVWPR